MSSSDTRPVVVGVDGAPGSAGALRYGVTEAGRRGVALHLVHVLPTYPPMAPLAPVPVSELRSIGSSVLERASATARDLATQLEVSTELAVGSRTGGIVEASADAQLVVVGRDTRRVMDRVLTGTVTAGVAARAACDVVVVPSFWSGDRSHGRVVAGIKSRRNAHELLSRAFGEAAARGATLTLVTAWELPDPYLDRIEVRTHAADWEAAERRVIEETLTQWRSAYPDVPVEIRIVHGPAANVLLHASRESRPAAAVPAPAGVAAIRAPRRGPACVAAAERRPGRGGALRRPPGGGAGHRPGARGGRRAAQVRPCASSP